MLCKEEHDFPKNERKHLLTWLYELSNGEEK